MNEKRVKLFASLANSKYRKEHKLFLVEGVHGVSGLVESGWKVNTILATEDFDIGNISAKTDEIDLERTGQRTINRICTTKTPQDIVAVAVIPDNDLSKTAKADKILIADGLKDPGNLGTMIRTAEALGFGSVVTTSGSVDLYNPKTVRATQGAMFSIDIAQRITIADLLKRLGSSHTFYALCGTGDIDLKSVRIEKRIALIVGSEIAGIDNRLISACRYLVNIPIHGNSESLNAAVAAGIAMYHFVGRK
ncbi:MAG: RNA methyltransferase [candidate division Zixibacteria bacterium]